MKKYLEFINESKLQLILEANINYANDFIEILSEIESPIADELEKLNGKEVDVKTNHIALDYDKTDYILFIPDDKYEKLPHMITGDTYMNASVAFANRCKERGYDISNVNYPPDDISVEVVKNFTKEELKELADLEPSDLYSHITWMSGREKRAVFYKTKFIKKDLVGIKETPFKIGRFVTNILTKAGVEYSPKDIEAFVDKFKSEMKKKSDVFNTNFEIVHGENIRHFYHERNYYSHEGTLGGSCMRYAKCQKYLDIYVDNNNVSLIIFKSEKDNTKIVGRALLWDAVQKSTGEKIKFMDRIYVNKSNDIELFKQYAIKSGFHYKHKQDYSGIPLMFNNQVLSDEDSLINIENISLYDDDYYPYVDTVKYYDSNNDLLTNDEDINYEKMLDSTNGGRCEECEGAGSVTCNWCDGEGTRDCPKCDGDGECDCKNCDGSGKFDMDCAECEGSGSIDGEECSNCDGSGIVQLDCDECSNGQVECYNCEGAGSSECNNCDGDGTVNCPECNW